MTRLTVAVRVRPLSDREIAAKSVSIVSVEDGKTVAVTNIKVPEQNAGDSRERVRRFTFDYCFGSESTQHDVYQNVGREVAKAIKRRFHSCILAYGQSSSGKTHTMIGDAEDAGLAPRLCQNIFDCLRETAIGSEAENLNATVSYLEIYNEKVRDLLEPAGGLDQGISLKVREHPKKGPYVQGLSEKRISGTDELLKYLSVGNSNRTIASTNANKRSSRSHSVFTVTCTGGLKLRLVDLAGSERAGSRSHTTSRFREGANINKSLVALRNVISALADSSRLLRHTRKRFIPYRDSILTWLLKDTLSGNSKTILISTVSPSSTCYNETVNTLRFGQRAKQIIVQPLVNEDPKERTIRELRAEIAKLKELLSLTQSPVIIKKECRASLQNQQDQEWEEAEEFDSGINSSTSFASFEDDTSLSSSSIPSSPEDEYPTLNESKSDFFSANSQITPENYKPNAGSSEDEENFTNSACQITSSFQTGADNGSTLIVTKPNIINKCAEGVDVQHYETTQSINVGEGNNSPITNLQNSQEFSKIDNIIEIKSSENNSTDYIERLDKFNLRKARVFEHCEEDPERNNYSISSSFTEDEQLHFCTECEDVDSFQCLQCNEKRTSTANAVLCNNSNSTAEENWVLNTRKGKEGKESCQEVREKTAFSEAVSRIDITQCPLEEDIEHSNEYVCLSDSVKEIPKNSIVCVFSPRDQVETKNEEAVAEVDVSETDLHKEAFGINPILSNAGSDNFNRISVLNDTIYEVVDKTHSEEIVNTSTIELIPLMDVTSDISKPKPLRRTFSVDQKMNLTPPLFSSTENLTKKTSSLRKSSVDRSMNSLLPNGKKGEGIIKSEVKSKIDSYRKPRSQIVAAVTSRLYSKVKKKEASTDTDDINFKILPKELSICSNARMRLQELSRKAVRASKRKNADTQTELLSVLRVKEISTDVDDLRFVFDEVRDADVETQAIDLVDSATNCSLSSEYKSGVTLTRTCGTSMDEDERISLSFAKYFEDYLKPKYEILGAGGNANPIFTSAVNINVNHNYNIEHLNECVSEDSLEETPVNMCFPDLISNHNSLEQNALEHPKIIRDLRYASLQVLPDENSCVLSDDDFTVKSESFVPSISYEEDLMEDLDAISLETLYAPEIYLHDNPSDDYDIFYKLPPLTCKPNIIYETLNPPAEIREAVVLKSIMKQQESSSEEECSTFTDIPDSLNYYHEKKKVRFDEASTSQKSDEKMFEAMNNFMKEVTTLMSNLTKVAGKMDTKTLQEESYDLELTINDVKGLNHPKQKSKVRRKKNKTRPTHFVYADAQNQGCFANNCCPNHIVLAQNNSQTNNSQSNLADNHMQTYFNQAHNNFHPQFNQPQNLPHSQFDPSQMSQGQYNASQNNSHANNFLPSSSTNFMQNHNSVEFVQNSNTPVNSPQFMQSTSQFPTPFANNSNFTCTEAQTHNDLLYIPEDEFPVNKYEALVENSCDRLEKLVQKIETTVSAAEELHKFPQPFSVNQDWVYNRSVMDDSSLESNQAFSDYGSLPRRKRVSSCSPSGYLRQLTSMRRQIVESSREELLNEAQIHM